MVVLLPLPELVFGFLAHRSPAGPLSQSRQCQSSPRAVVHYAAHPPGGLFAMELHPVLAEVALPSPLAACSSVLSWQLFPAFQSHGLTFWESEQLRGI